MSTDLTAAIPRRMLHTMLRVGDLNRSIRFYTELMHMKLLRREEYPDGLFTLAFLGYGDELDHSVLELTYNWGKSDYDHGTAYGHIALGVEDVYAATRRLQQMGAAVRREPGPLSSRPASVAQVNTIAFIDDPDGYRIELIQRC